MGRHPPDAREVPSHPLARDDKQGSLNLWSEASRGAPNAFLWGGLFGTFGKGKREVVKQEPIPMVGQFTGHFTGFRLDQADLDVFLQLVHMGRMRPHEPVVFSERALLTSLGRVRSSGTRAWLRASIQRMQACSVWITKGTRSYAGALLGSLVHEDGEDGTYAIKLNPELTGIFFAGWSTIHWELRQNLATPLAQWLHSFTVSLSRPLTIPLADVVRLSGSRAANTKRFRERLRDAAEDCRRNGHPIEVRIARGKKAMNVTFTRIDGT